MGKKLSLTILGSSLRSRDGCEAPSKDRHHDKINILELIVEYLYEQPSVNCELISALGTRRASLKAVDLEKYQHGSAILNLYSENFCRNVTMATPNVFFVFVIHMFLIFLGGTKM